MSDFIREKDCNKCIFHCSGECSQWECNFIHYRDALDAVKKLSNIEKVLIDLVKIINIGRKENCIDDDCK